MKKLLKLSCILSSLLLFAACENMEEPTPPDTNPSSLGLNQDDYGSIDGSSSMNAEDFAMQRDPNAFADSEYSPEDVLVSIYFSFDNYSISPSERAKLQDVAQKMQNDNSFRVVCYGYTDWLGSDEYNNMLSDKRAFSVKDYLISLASDDSRLETVAKGEIGSSQNVDKNSAEAIEDRRVDVVKSR